MTQSISQEAGIFQRTYRGEIVLSYPSAPPFFEVKGQGFRNFAYYLQQREAYHILAKC